MVAQNGAMSTNLSGSSSVVLTSFWLRFIYSEIAVCLFLLYYKLKLKKYIEVWLQTYDDSLPWVCLHLDCISLASSDITMHQRQCLFKRLLKMLLAIVCCILISYNNVDHGLYIFTD